MSHFTVLTVITPERLEANRQKLREKFSSVIDSGDVTAMDSDADSDMAELVLKAAGEGELDELFTYAAVHEAIDDLLLPYQEYDGQDHLKKYLEFEDLTEDVQEDVDSVIEEGGYMDTNPGYVGKTYGELYMSLWEKREEELKEEVLHHGYPEDQLDAITAHDLVAMCYAGNRYREVEGEKKYGYYHNPQGNWDWYLLGGRWRCSLPIKEGCTSGFTGRPGTMTPPPEDKNRVDCARICDLDMDVFEVQTQEGIDTFWEKYQTYMETGEESQSFYGVHHTLMQMGIEFVNAEEHAAALQHNRDVKKASRNLEYLHMSEEEVEGLGIFEVGNRESFLRQFEGDEEALSEEANQDLVDVPTKEYGRHLSKKELETDFRWYFEWSTYAALDDNGWHVKGEMGWWGMSSDNTEDRQNWSKSFFDKFIRSNDPQSFVAVVDCHI